MVTSNIWFLVGILYLLLEIFKGGRCFICFGFSAIITGLFSSLRISYNLPSKFKLEILLFAFTFFILFFILQLFEKFFIEIKKIRR